MSTATLSCESCSMPIETGRYCAYCSDEHGNLQDFDTRFANMVAWQQRSHPEQSADEAQAATIRYMATMPAWRDHPDVLARLT